MRARARTRFNDSEPKKINISSESHIKICINKITLWNLGRGDIKQLFTGLNLCEGWNNIHKWNNPILHLVDIYGMYFNQFNICILYYITTSKIGFAAKCARCTELPQQTACRTHCPIFFFFQNDCWIENLPSICPSRHEQKHMITSRVCMQTFQKKEQKQKQNKKKHHMSLLYYYIVQANGNEQPSSAKHFQKQMLP